MVPDLGTTATRRCSTHYLGMRGRTRPYVNALRTKGPRAYRARMSGTAGESAWLVIRLRSSAQGGADRRWGSFRAPERARPCLQMSVHAPERGRVLPHGGTMTGRPRRSSTRSATALAPGHASAPGARTQLNAAGSSPAVSPATAGETVENANSRSARRRARSPPNLHVDRARTMESLHSGARAR